MFDQSKLIKPKYPVGSLVVCEKVGVNTPCKVIDCYPISPINEVPRYRISSLDNPDSYFTVTEEELRMSSEPKSSEPKYPVGSSVSIKKDADNRQFIVSEFLSPKSGIRVMPAYRIFPVGESDNIWTVTESELSPWRAESKYRPGQVIQLTHDEKIIVEAVYIKEGTILVDFVGYLYDKPVTQYKEILEESLDDKIKVYEYQKNMEILTKDNQTYTNEQGGKQSFVSARFDCIPPVVLRLLAQCLGFGARKYGKENWKQIDQVDHLNHAMNHINEWNRGDRSEPHLVNAMARLTFALWQAVDQKQQPDTYIHPDEVK